MPGDGGARGWKKKIRARFLFAARSSLETMRCQLNGHVEISTKYTERTNAMPA